MMTCWYGKIRIEIIDESLTKVNVSCTKVLLHDFNREGDNLSVTGGIPERDLAEQRWQNIELKNKEKLMTSYDCINSDWKGKEI